MNLLGGFPKPRLLLHAVMRFSIMVVAVAVIKYIDWVTAWWLRLSYVAGCKKWGWVGFVLITCIYVYANIVIPNFSVFSGNMRLFYLNSSFFLKHKRSKPSRLDAPLYYIRCWLKTFSPSHDHWNHATPSYKLYTYLHVQILVTYLFNIWF